MIRRHRSFVAITLALLLTLTGHSMAVARSMPSASGAVVLCTGAGPITILTDVQGQPVGPAHICPDCTLSLIVALDAAEVVLAHPMGRGEDLVALSSPFLPQTAKVPFAARDPPAAV